MEVMQNSKQLLNTVKRSYVVITAIFFTLITVLFYSCSNEKLQVSSPATPSLPVISVGKSTESTYLEYPASVHGTVDLEIRPQIAGSIDRIYVNEGQRVKAGQPLFKINELPFLEALNNAKATLRAAEATVVNAQLEIDKLLPLVQNKVVSDIQLKSARTAISIANANVAQSKAGVAIAQINLGYTLIKAPVSGYIGRLPKKQGSLVSPSDPEPLTQLSDVHEVHVYFSLSEADFVGLNAKYPSATTDGMIKKLPEVSLLLSDNTEYKQKGKIDMIDGQFDKNTGSITLRASFPNPSGLLRSGNTGKVRLSMEHTDAIVVPQSATIEIQDKVFLYTVGKDNKVVKQPIVILGASGDNYLVKEGVKYGDRIVSKGFENLKDGDTIIPEVLDEKTLKVAAN